MSDIDVKLDYILKSNAAVQVFFDKDSVDDYDKLIPAIKQAFAEANYIEIPDDSQEVEALAAWHSGVLLTGQEWLDKLAIQFSKDKVNYSDEVWESVQRAAGLTT